MKYFCAVLITLLQIYTLTESSLCQWVNIVTVGRILFGEGHETLDIDRLGIAYVVINRMYHDAFPESLKGVVYHRYGNDHQFVTLDNPEDDALWKSAWNGKTDELYNSLRVAAFALCGLKQNPLDCDAVYYCSHDPCSATDGNQWIPVTEKTKLGNYWFACTGDAR